MAPKVLLVQKDTPQRTEAQAVLVLIGCNVTVTDSALEAGTLATASEFDFVVLELLLEDGNGYRLADAIRDRESSSKRACILATGDLEEDQVSLCRECGIDEVVNLNRDPDGISAILHKWMAKLVFRMWKHDDFAAPTLSSLSVTH
jgi:CheY-like chemotaxis protein